MIRSTAVLLPLLCHAAFTTSFPSVAALSTEEAYKVPSFEQSDVGRNRLDELTSVLGSTGLFAIDVSDTDFVHMRDIALSGLCQCSDDMLSVDGTDTASLSDGFTTRTTLATATMGNRPLPLPQGLEQTCGVDTAEAMEALRDHVASVSRTFINALDRLLLPSHSVLLRNAHGGIYSSVSSIVKASSNLEHFHVYSKDSRKDLDSPKDSKDDVLALHTDAGLFLTFVPGLACNDSDEDSSFYIQRNGKTQRAVFPQGSIAVMLGAGAERWLSTPDHVPLRATRHAVKMRHGDTRAWYGTMHLVPQSAIVQDSPQRTFADMREAMVMSKKTRRFGDDPQADMDVSIGCGNSQVSEATVLNLKDHRQTRSRARLQHVADASVCNNVTNFFCWMSCLDIPEASNAQGYINEGYSLYCVDPSVLVSSGNRVSKAVEPCNENGETGTAMNSNCMGSWQPTAPGVPAQQVNVEPSQGNDEPFCYGATSMYMEGFQWVGTTCIIYLFPQWVLSTAGSLTGACIGTLFFGVALEWVIRRRKTVVESLPPGWKQVGASTIMYGVQLTMGYFIMLVVMTYSGPLFLCVVVGLMSGHLFFNMRDYRAKAKEHENSDRTKVPSSSSESQDDSDPSFQDEPDKNDCCSGKKEGNIQSISVPEGSTPCCQYTL